MNKKQERKKKGSYFRKMFFEKEKDQYTVTNMHYYLEKMEPKRNRSKKRINESPNKCRNRAIKHRCMINKNESDI